MNHGYPPTDECNTVDFPTRKGFEALFLPYLDSVRDLPEGQRVWWRLEDGSTLSVCATGGWESNLELEIVLQKWHRRTPRCLRRVKEHRAWV
jgi:hypothetical protein